MSFNLTRFNIIGLHGDMDVKISLDENILVIVAENGLGKTTIVNILYYTLSQQWYRLTEYQFEKVEFTINKTNFTIQREELNEYVKLRRLRGRSSYRAKLGPKYAAVADYMLDHNIIQKISHDPDEAEVISRQFEIPIRVVMDIYNELLYATKTDLFSSNLEDITEYLVKEIKSQILYLPTYRRIEKDLKNIFPELETNLDALRSKRKYNEEENARKYIELVEFGMDDVQFKVDQKLTSLYINFTNNLRQSLMGGYLKDILNKDYTQYDYSFLQSLTTKKLTEILSRIDKSIIQETEKSSLMNFVESNKNSASITNEGKIIAYFIQKLIGIYEQQSVAEKDVISFVDICNTYFTNKRFIYVRDERKIKVFLLEHDKEINFAKLSSGEKQIVSLFSHLYLSANKSFFVIIDEPELSLSVTWQERLLNDILNAYSTGIIAVTHSPYIFSNGLEKYTRGFNEFITIK